MRLPSPLLPVRVQLPFVSRSYTNLRLDTSRSFSCKARTFNMMYARDCHHSCRESRIYVYGLIGEGFLNKPANEHDILLVHQIGRNTYFIGIVQSISNPALNKPSPSHKSNNFSTNRITGPENFPKISKDFQRMSKKLC